jgi:hypothetical protein
MELKRRINKMEKEWKMKEGKRKVKERICRTCKENEAEDNEFGECDVCYEERFEVCQN